MPTLGHARTAVAAAVLTYALGVPSRSCAVEISVAVQGESDAIVIKASTVVDADAGRAWQVLTDYARYPEFIPGVRTSRVVRRSAEATTVEQTGRATLGFLRLPVAIVYEIVESPPDRLRSRGVIANVGTLDSGYALEPVGTKLRLDYVGRLTTWSALLRPLAQVSGRQTIADQFQGLADEIERRDR